MHSTRRMLPLGTATRRRKKKKKSCDYHGEWSKKLHATFRHVLISMDAILNRCPLCNLEYCHLEIHDCRIISSPSTTLNTHNTNPSATLDVYSPMSNIFGGDSVCMSPRSSGRQRKPSRLLNDSFFADVPVR